MSALAMRLKAAAKTEVARRQHQSNKVFKGIGHQRELRHFPEFCSQQMNIIHIDTGQLVPFDLNWIQRQLLAIELRDRRNGIPPWYIIIKWRKPGVSTYWQIRWMHGIWSRAHSEYLTYAQTSDDTRDLFTTVIRAYNAQPPDRRHRKTDAGTTFIEFPDWDGKYRAITAGATASGRGGTKDGIHFSEAAHYPDLTTLYTGLSKSVRNSSSFILESTPNGKKGSGGHFYDFWKTAKRGESKFKPLFFPWHADPANQLPLREPDEISRTLTDEEAALQAQHDLTDRQVKWWREERRQIVASGRSASAIHQEHPADDESCFLEGGEPYYAKEHLQAAMAHTRPPIHPGDLEMDWGDLMHWIEKGVMKVWEEPKQGDAYVLGIDSSEGIGRDDVAIIAVNIRTGRQACTWAYNQMPPDQVGHVVVGNPDYGLGWMFKAPSSSVPAYVIAERDGPGLAFLSGLMQKAEYPADRIYHHVDETADDPKPARRAGWKHNHTQLTMAVGRMLREEYPRILDSETVKSIRSVSSVAKDGSAEFTGRDRAVAMGLTAIGLEHAEPPGRYIMVGGMMIDMETGEPVPEKEK